MTNVIKNIKVPLTIQMITYSIAGMVSIGNVVGWPQLAGVHAGLIVLNIGLALFAAVQYSLVRSTR